MEKKKNKKCSSNDHEDIDAISYCEQCKIYMCKKCQNFHNQLFKNHNQANIDKEKDDIFVDLCKEKNHAIKVEYYCRTHNLLCCAKCIARIKTKENGQHKECDIYSLEEIKEEKRNKLEDNIKYLEEISKSIDELINDLKKMFEKINDSKEEVKLKIQKVFTQIKNAFNEREDELLQEVDNQYNILFANEKIIKDSEKLPKIIGNNLKKGKNIVSYWDNNKLSSTIYTAIDIEKNINDINTIINNIQKCKLNINSEIKFSPVNEKEINKFIEKLKKFGFIYKSNEDNNILGNNNIIQKDNQFNQQKQIH